MSKLTEQTLAGQPVFAQVLKLMDPFDFKQLVKKFGRDRYYRSFKSWDHVVTMLFGILSRCDSMIEACEGMRV